MNEWLHDEIAELDQAQEDQRSREQRLILIQQHTSRLWEDLKVRIQDAADQINASERLRQITGRLECQSGYTNQIFVNKSVLPAVYLTVKAAPNAFDIHREVVATVESKRNAMPKETLHVDLDNGGNPFLKTDEGAPLTLEEAVHHIFRPFLHPELIETTPSKGPGFGRLRM